MNPSTSILTGLPLRLPDANVAHFICLNTFGKIFPDLAQQTNLGAPEIRGESSPLHLTVPIHHKTGKHLLFRASFIAEEGQFGWSQSAVHAFSIDCPLLPRFIRFGPHGNLYPESGEMLAFIKNLMQ